MTEKVDKARVVFRCSECGAIGKSGDKCAKDDCKAKGKPLVKSCEKSGTPPHVSK